MFCRIWLVSNMGDRTGLVIGEEGIVVGGRDDVMEGDEASFVLFLSLGELRICGIARLLNSFSWSTWAVRGFHTIVQKALVKHPIGWVISILLMEREDGWGRLLP